MTALLLRFFAKDRSDRGRLGRLGGTVGIICNLLLCAAKLLAGLLAGSVAMIADAANNFTDAGSSLVTLLGFRLARRPADGDHPYGHARYEYLSALAVAGMILLIGWDLGKTSFQKFLHPAPLSASLLTLAVLAASILVKLWLAGFYKKIAGLTQSGSLRAAAADSLSDVLATSAVFTGSAANLLFDWNIDALLGLGVAIFILVSGFRLAKETVSPLLGQRGDPELMEKLTDLVRSQEKVLGIHDLLVHDYGPGQCFASLHAELSAQEDPLECHDIIDSIETQALSQLGVHLVIHYDPVLTDDPEWDRLRCETEKLAAGLDPRLSVHDFRLVRGAKQIKAVFDLAVPYDMTEKRQELQEALQTALASQGCIAVIRFDGKP